MIGKSPLNVVASVVANTILVAARPVAENKAPAINNRLFIKNVSSKSVPVRQRARPLIPLPISKHSSGADKLSSRNR